MRNQIALAWLKGLWRLQVAFVLSLSLISFCARSECDSRDAACNPSFWALRAAYTVFNPVFTPGPGFHSTGQDVAVWTLTPNATIYYTYDGSTPTPSSSIHTVNSAFHVWSLAGRTLSAYGTKADLMDSDVTRGKFSFQPLRTGQTISYGARDDGALRLGVPISHSSPRQHPVYTNDYTTLDYSTGLLWKTCSEGQTGATCSGGVSAQGFVASTAQCTALNSLNGGNGYAGKTNWRLPTMKELTTLTDFSLAANTYDAAAFPGTANYAYWSSTPYPPVPADAWYVDYSSGNSFATTNTNGYHTRCVSAPTIPAADSFVDNGDGTILDEVTGLIWQKCSNGQTNDSSCSGASAPAASWSAALAYCNSLSLNGRNWRLPNVNELHSLQDFTKASGAKIDLRYFPNTPAGAYWSSSTYAGNTANAWYVNFGSFNALDFDLIKSNATSNVRCVAGP